MVEPNGRPGWRDLTHQIELVEQRLSGAIVEQGRLIRAEVSVNRGKIEQLDSDLRVVRAAQTASAARSATLGAVSLGTRQWLSVVIAAVAVLIAVLR